MDNIETATAGDYATLEGWGVCAGPGSVPGSYRLTLRPIPPPQGGVA